MLDSKKKKKKERCWSFCILSQCVNICQIVWEVPENYQTNPFCPGILPWMENIPLIPLHRLVSTTDFYTIPNARSTVKLYSRIPYEITTRLSWCFYLFYLYAVLVPSFLSKCRGSREKNSSVDLMWLIFIAFSTACLIPQPLIWLKNNFWKES